MESEKDREYNIPGKNEQRNSHGRKTDETGTEVNVEHSKLQEEICERNIIIYGDKIGPTIEWYRSKGLSWEQIIEKSIKIGDGDVSYDNCQPILEKILENFDAEMDKYICDVQTIYCDLKIGEKFKVCFHYHDMAGLAIIALTKESEEIAKKISNFIDRNFSISPKL